VYRMQKCSVSDELILDELRHQSQTNNLSSRYYPVDDKREHVVPEINPYGGDNDDDDYYDAVAAMLGNPPKPAFVIQDEPKPVQLLVIWHGEYAKELHVHALLMELDNDFNWDEDKLRRLHKNCRCSLDTYIDPSSNEWLLRDMTTLVTTVKVMNEGHRWDISISKGIRSNAKRLLWTDTKR
jgi:hypothetical protein